MYLPAAGRSRTSVRDALEHLRSKGLLADFAVADEHEGRPEPVRLRGYELSPLDDRPR